MNSSALRLSVGCMVCMLTVVSAQLGSMAVCRRICSDYCTGNRDGFFLCLWCECYKTNCGPTRCKDGQVCVRTKTLGWFARSISTCVDILQRTTDQETTAPTTPIPTTPTPTTMLPTTMMTTTPITDTIPTTTMHTTPITMLPTTMMTTTTTTPITDTIPTTTINTTQSTSKETAAPSTTQPMCASGKECNGQAQCGPGQLCLKDSESDLTGHCCPKAVANLKPKCMEKSVTGPCRAGMIRYFYNTTSFQCQQFFYGGCSKGANHFDNLEECQSECENRCLLPKDHGDCRAFFTNYYYNRETGGCEEFQFYGCIGNANRFDTIEDCQDTCVDV